MGQAKRNRENDKAKRPMDRLDRFFYLMKRLTNYSNRQISMLARNRQKWLTGNQTKIDLIEEDMKDKKPRYPNFTFKTEHPTGRYRSFDQPTHHVKITGVEVGYIEPEHPHKIHFQVRKTDIANSGNPNCPWKWVHYKKEFSSVEEAKAWIKENTEKIHQEIDIWKEG